VSVDHITTKPEGAVAPDSAARLHHRLRLGAISLALMALAFIQEPGRIVADTKLDLVIDPQGFLSRALTLWEPLGFFGQLQNQAYGYLFPIGPFFALGDVMGLPAWVVQRLWWAVLLISAFLGVVRLARLIGVSSPIAAIVGGLAYALAPRMVTEIGVLSVEVLPFAVAPWVLVPLVRATRGELNFRRAAAWSGLALLCAGGVNAVATAVLVPLGALWILTQITGGARWRLLGWWSLGVVLATVWWAIPLLVLGRFSPPFLDWIESSSVTTLLTSPDTVLRGTSQWVAYVADVGGPVWPGGWQLVTSVVLVSAAGCVATIGLIGLSLSRTPARGFLVGTLLLGFILVSLGHTGLVEGIAAGDIRQALDGLLAPLRNTHKADLLLRLPLAIGVAFSVDALLRRSRSPWRTAAVSLVTITVLVGSWPLATGAVARDRSFASIPEYWSEAAEWLAQQSPTGRALVVPGASFGVYTWGRTQDEPLQPLATTAWAVRDAVPLSSAGNIRWLDAIEERLESGRGSPGLADALSRAGVSYVVVRNDIDQRRTGAPRSVLVRQALLRSGGFTPVEGLGPALPPYRTESTVVDGGLQDTVAAVEMWRVDSPYAPPDPRVTLRTVAGGVLVSGAAESLLEMADADVLGTGLAVTAGDEGPLEAAGVDLAKVVTDSFRRTELNVGSVRNNRSSTLTVGDDFVQERRVHDYLPIPPDGRQSVAEFVGGAVSASSSGSAATALRARSSGAAPWNAVDTDQATAWVSGDLAPGVGQWWQVDLDDPIEAASITVRFVVGDPAGAGPTEVTVTTDTGDVTVPVESTDLPQELPLPVGPTRSIRLTLAAVEGGGDGDGFGIREVQIPGVDQLVERRVATAGVADGGAIVLQARHGERPGCAAVGGELVCTPLLVATGEERSGLARTVTVAATGDYRVRVYVRPKPGLALDGLLEPISGTAPRATASSVSSSDPAARPQSAIDGVNSTAWLASIFDPKPELTITWSQRKRIRGVRVDVAPGLVASRPLSVTVLVNGRETPAVISGRGLIRFPPQEATTLTLRFDNAVTMRSLDPQSGAITALPLGVSDIRIIGAESLDNGPRLSDTATVPCGFGPEVFIDGVSAATTQISATVSDVLTDRLITATPCDGRVVTLAQGQHLIDVPSTEEFAIDTVVLEPVEIAGVPDALGDVDVLAWDATHREVAVTAAAEPRVLETTENANAGWSATVEGLALEPVRVDGWRQAWVVAPVFPFRASP